MKKNKNRTQTQKAYPKMKNRPKYPKRKNNDDSDIIEEENCDNDDDNEDAVDNSE